MKAEALLSWDKADLAGLLALRYADADDLIEAFPAIEKAGSMEAALLDEFIEQNWRTILHDYDVHELMAWVEEKEQEEEWAKLEEDWKNEEIESEEAYAESRDIDFINSVIYSALMFVDRNPEDLGVIVSLARKS